MQSEERKRYVAIHEAAHAVVAHHLGCPTETVTIEPDVEAGSGGHALIVHGDFYSEVSGEDWKYARRAISSYAGHMATIRLGYDEDFEDAGADDDYYSAALEIDSIAGLGSDKNDRLIKQMLETSALMVEMTWDQIEVVADALEEELTIDGSKIAELLRTSTSI